MRKTARQLAEEREIDVDDLFGEMCRAFRGSYVITLLAADFKSLTLNAQNQLHKK